MTGPREPSASPRADARRNRDRILDAGAALLARDPSATLTDIAQAAGVSRATIYRHFADVDALRGALLEEAEAIGRELLRDRLPAMLATDAGPTVDELLDLVRIALPMEHRWTRMIASEPIPDAGLITSFGPIARAVVRRAQARGEFRADLDLDLTTEALISLAMFAVRKVHTGGATVDQALSLLRTYLDGMRPAAGRRSVS